MIQPDWPFLCSHIQHVGFFLPLSPISNLPSSIFHLPYFCTVILHVRPMLKTFSSVSLLQVFPFSNPCSEQLPRYFFLKCRKVTIALLLTPFSNSSASSLPPRANRNSSTLAFKSLHKLAYSDPFLTLYDPATLFLEHKTLSPIFVPLHWLSPVAGMSYTLISAS